MKAAKKAAPKKKTAGAQGGGRGFLVLIVFLIIFVVAMAGVYAIGALQDRHDKQFIGLLGEQRVLSQQVTKLAGQATRGDADAFRRLAAGRDRFAANLKLLGSGDPETGMPPSPAEINEQYSAVAGTWRTFDINIDTILAREEVVASLREIVQTINDKAAHLLALSDEVATLMAQTGATTEQVYIASRQLMLSQRIVNNVNRVLEGGEGSVTAADRFGRDAALFGRVVNGMLKGNRGMGIARVTNGQVRTKLQEVDALFGDISEQVELILGRSPEMFQVSEAGFELGRNSDLLLNRISELENAYLDYIGTRTINTSLGVLFGLAALLLVFILGLQLRHEGQRRLQAAEAERRKSEETNMRNQQAIMRLLDEMGDLADGDLTVNATVTEDITGAIADSINYAIDTLRNLVAAINRTALQISQSSEQSKAIAVHLAEASEHQVDEITRATEAVNNMATSIEGVSANAGVLSGEAGNSVNTAKQGREAVQKTIEGMNTIREQIQETSKRIKRLGESSQEIGDIVELINDIAEQTNILALNAAIQAAMAGESGRGFAVVADEVQRLAERSADATKQIEALVKTIQTDTNEAVISMEQSTAGVVAGAKLAEDAGAALDKIDRMADHLSQLVQSISDATKQQAQAASDVSRTMSIIKEITVQTSEGTSQTTSSIASLNEMANELKRSVSGFKLPG